MELSDFTKARTGVQFLTSSIVKSWIDSNFRYFFFREQTNLEKLTGEETTEYSSGASIVTTTLKNYISNTSGRVTQRNTTMSDGKREIENRLYPDQVTSSSYLGLDNLTTTELQRYQDLSANLTNKIDEPIQVENLSYSESLLKSSLITRRIFDLFEGNLRPSYLKSYKSSSSLENRIKYLNYDEKGNPMEVSIEDGPPVVYLWGYEDSFPIAKIENATSSQVASALGTTVANLKNYTEANMGSINNLRTSLSYAMVTTYTYDPLIGITGITDPKGYTTTFVYDDFNRLKFVKDEEGNILSENQYKYKLSSN